MPRKQRVTFSLAPDVVQKLDRVDHGDRSAFVERAIRSTEVDDDE